MIDFNKLGNMESTDGPIDPFEGASTFDRQFLVPFEGSLIPEQLEIAEKLIMDQENDFFITGGAGTGKSYLIKGLRSIIPLGVCSTTGMSAINIGGTTVDRMFNFSRDEWKVRNYGKLKDVMKNVPRDIILEECSMAGINMANLIYDIARRFDKRIILVGDMAQASPVKDDWATQSRLFKGAKQFRLQHCHRQSDLRYINALNSIRQGVVDDNVRAEFRQCLDPMNQAPDDYVRLYASNAAADQYNAVRLNKLPQTTPVVKLVGDYQDMRTENTQYEISDAEMKRSFDGARIAHDEWMQIGARVLIGVNGPGYVNGDAGIVVDMVKGNGEHLSASSASQVPCAHLSHITILLDRTHEEMDIHRVERPIYNALRKPIALATGFPVKLGWAHTIHKSQGMTLQHAWLSLESIVQCFKDESKHGIAYVGLSRTTSIAGLRIDRWMDEAIYCSNEVREFV